MPSWNEKPELNPTKIPTEIDVAWSAGIFEGEGSMRGTRYSTLQVTVTQKDPEILYRLKEWFGGGISLGGGKTTPEAWRCHVWCLYGDKSRLFIANIYKFLSARRRAQVDATKAMEFLGGRDITAMSLDEVRTALTEFANGRLSQRPEAIKKRAAKYKWPSYQAKNFKVANRPQERVM